MARRDRSAPKPLGRVLASWRWRSRRSLLRPASVRARCPPATAAGSCWRRSQSWSRSASGCGSRGRSTRPRTRAETRSSPTRATTRMAYERIAAALYEDGRYGTPEMRSPSDWSPGAPLLYAGVYFLTGGVDPERARIAVALLGAAMILIVYLLGRRLAGPVAGVVAAPAGRRLSRLPRQQRPASERADRGLHPLGGGALVHVGRRMRAGGPGHGCCRAPCSAPPRSPARSTCRSRPCSGCWRWCWSGRRRSWRLGLVSAALLVGTFAVVLAPWTVRNYVVLDRFVPVTTGGGKALFVATYLPGNGRQLQVKRALIKRYTGTALRLARRGARHAR